MPEFSLSYKKAGVDIDAGHELVERIKKIAEDTKRPGVLGNLGGFAALFELPLGRYRKPVIVSATDGVGTKLKLAIASGQHNTIGIDLVAMCVNDLIVCGAEPLFFLDYYASSKLDVDVAAAVIEGIGKGCKQAGAALVGGETAEMPGLYQAKDYDLAGFCVGIVEKDLIIDGCKVQIGDQIIGLASSGPHSNGYSLIRKILELRNLAHDQSLINTLLAPTRIYVKPILKLLENYPVHAMAHITGGGLLDNIARVLPPGCQAVIETSCWQQPSIFNWLQEQGRISTEDMHRTFNCGIGMTLVVPKEDTAAIQQFLNTQAEPSWVIGEITRASETNPRVVIRS